MFREDLSRNFGFILHDVSRLLRTTFDRRVKALGFTRSQWWVLTHLFRNDGVTQSELAEVLEIEKPTLGRLLDRLESKGWVRREADAADRRVKRLFLTEEVEPAIKAMRAAAAEMRRDALAGLSPEEQERFVDTLLAVKTNLTSYDSAAARNGNGGSRTANAGSRNGNAGVRNGNSGVRNGNSGVRNGNSGVRNGNSGVRNGNSGSRNGNSGSRNGSRLRGR
jgi:DNA-binding MarR family transcriptional regulator